MQTWLEIMAVSMRCGGLIDAVSRRMVVILCRHQVSVHDRPIQNQSITKIDESLQDYLATIVNQIEMMNSQVKSKTLWQANFLVSL